MLNCLSEQENLLSEFAKFWRIYHDIIMKWLLKIFNYLNSTNAKIKKGISLKLMMINIIRDEIFNKFKPNLIKEFFDTILIVRIESDDTKIQTLKHFVDFMCLVYINPSENFYCGEIERNIIGHCLEVHNPTITKMLNESNDLMDFLEKGLLLISHDVEIYKKFLPAKTLENLKSELDRLVFINNAKPLMEALLPKVLESKNIKSLELVYNIFKDDKLVSIPIITSIFKSFSRSQYTEFIASYELNYPNISDARVIATQTNYVFDFSKIFEQHNRILNLSFSNENPLKISLFEVIEHVQHSAPKFNHSIILPYFISKQLQDYQLNIEVIKANLDVAINLFNTIPDKDIFIEQYKKLLALRLYQFDSRNIEMETFMINHFENLGGSNYIASLTIMLKDYNSSKEFTSAFLEETKALHSNNNIELNLLICEGDKWPLVTSPKIKYVGIILDILDSMTGYFISKNNYRSLKVLNDVSSIDMLAKLDHGSFTFRLNMFQACILLLFNSINSATESMQEDFLLDKLELIEPDYFSGLKQLVAVGLIIRDENTKSIKINRQFKNSESIILLNTAEEASEIRVEKIDDDRSFAIEAAIVRLMKRHKKLDHNTLVEHIGSEVRMFKITSESLKKKINNLIERELITRDKENMDIYEYNY